MSDKNTKAEALLKRAYSLKNDQDTKALYRDWAKTYDQTMMDGLEYLTPQETAKLLSDHLSNDQALILDVGSGTGLAGIALAKLGYSQMDALDYSPEMLAVAKEQNIYRNLIEADLNDPIALKDNSYDAMICTGTFTHSHVGANCLNELLRLLKPNGLFACTVQKDLWLDVGFKEWFEVSQNQSKIEMLSQSLGSYFGTSTEPDGWFLVWRKI